MLSEIYFLRHLGLPWCVWVYEVITFTTNVCTPSHTHIHHESLHSYVSFYWPWRLVIVALARPTTIRLFSTNIRPTSVLILHFLVDFPTKSGLNLIFTMFFSSQELCLILRILGVYLLIWVMRRKSLPIRIFVTLK